MTHRKNPAGVFATIVFLAVLSIPFSLFAATGNGAVPEGMLAGMDRVAPSATGMDVVQAISRQASAWRGRAGAGIRSRRIAIDAETLRQRGVRQGQDINLQLFDTVKVQARVSSARVNARGTSVIAAKIKNSKWGRVFMAASNGQVRARIIMPEQGRIYAIQYNPDDGSHYSLELDPRKAQFDDAEPNLPLAPAAPDSGLIQEMGAAQDVAPVAQADESVDASVVVDVMVVFSNDALTYAGSQAEVDNLIAIGMAMANDAHENTGTGIVLHLVHAEQVGYNGADDTSIDLPRLKNDGDGYMDGVHTLRDTYGADFVVLMVGDYPSDGGLGYLLTTTDGRPDLAFSVVTGPSFDSYAPGHEIGHNMGLSHAADQKATYSPGPTSWTTDNNGIGTKAAGWHWHPTPGAAGYCSVMTYTDAGYFAENLDHIRVGLFSDPGLSHMGEACGNATTAYNAYVLKQLKDVYAAYRARSIPADSIVVDAPGSGEYLYGGDRYTILWDSDGVAGNVKIELLQNGALDRVIDADTLNDRAYAWTVPAGISGNGYSIRISDLAGAITGSSDFFTIQEEIYSEPMDSNPGYGTGSGWEFGSPFGDNAYYGGADAAYSGSNIYDTNLDGVWGSTTYLTSTAIDCSGFTDVQLTFWGWFSMYTGYESVVEVSSDNLTWHQIYSQTGKFSATAWKQYSFDISAYADNQSTVYVRWGHIDNGGGLNYSGMSVDEVRLTGIALTAINTTTVVPAAIFPLLLGQ